MPTKIKTQKHNKIKTLNQLILSPIRTPGKEKRECIPELLQTQTFDSFVLKGKNIFPLEKEVLLLQSDKDENSEPTPIAKIQITEYTHSLMHGENYTIGIYEIKEVL